MRSPSLQNGIFESFSLIIICGRDVLAEHGFVERPIDEIKPEPAESASPGEGMKAFFFAPVSPRNRESVFAETPFVHFTQFTAPAGFFEKGILSNSSENLVNYPKPN